MTSPIALRLDAGRLPQEMTSGLSAVGETVGQPCGFRSLPYRTRTLVRQGRLLGVLAVAGAKYVPQPLLGLLTDCNGLTCILGTRSHYRHSDRSAR